MNITREYAMALFNYDPTSGLLTWKVPKSLRVKPGDEAGTVNSNGYKVVMIDYRWYKVSKLAWLITFGTWEPLLDHIDGNKLNNAIANLRPATVQQNNQNTTKRTSLMPCRGVVRRKRTSPYEARLWIGHGSRLIGKYDKLEDACAAAAAARAEAFGEFASTRGEQHA